MFKPVILFCWCCVFLIAIPFLSNVFNHVVSAGDLVFFFFFLATYASGVLKNLQFDKPSVYREGLDTEIESATNGGEGWMHDGLEPELFAEMYHSPEMEHLDHTQPWQHPPPYQSNNRSPSWFDTDL